MTRDELKSLEATLWHSADTLRANSDLKSTEYSTPVLGLIFLKFADNKYSVTEKEILKEYDKLNLPEEEKIDQKIKKAMESIEDYKPELKGILPKDEYFRLTRTDQTIPMQLLKNFSNIPKETDGDMFGQIYEYFLGNWFSVFTTLD